MLVAYAGKDPEDKPFSVKVSGWDAVSRPVRPYTPPLTEQMKIARSAAAREEMRRIGLRQFKERGTPQWAREIIIDVAERRGLCISDLAGRSRQDRITKARNEATYLIKARKPMLSSPQLGAWFERDHTSILHSLASYSEATGLPKLVGYDIEGVRERNRKSSAARAAIRSGEQQ